MVLGESIISLIMIIISVGLFFATYNFKQVGHSMGTFDAAFWPKMILGLILIFAFIQVLIGIKSIRKEGKLLNISMGFPRKTFILSILIITLYIVSMDILGFLLSTLLFQILFLLNLHEKKISVIFLVPTIMTAIYYVLFIKILFTPLPRGIGIFRMVSLLFY